MKFIYAILFAFDTLALILCSYSFLKLSDSGVGEMKFAALLTAIIFCIIFLVYILIRFVNLPSSGSQDELN